MSKQKGLNGEYWSYVIKNRRRKAWNAFVRFTACFVVFCTTYALILPAITVETNTYCGIEEHSHSQDCYAQAASETAIACAPVHAHTADCYDAAGALICGMADYVLHTHSGLCYDADGSLICSLPEKQEHIHSDSCYTLAETTSTEAPHTHDDSCYNVERLEQTCTLEETEGHTHGEACSTTTLICQKEFDAHVHTDGCYVTTLTCTQEETAGHVHSDACNGTVLVCTSEDGEHTHTDECYGTGLVCGQEESLGHTHGETCSTTTLVCQTETEPHVHGDTCYETTLTCTQEETEAHAHTDACFVTEKVLSCGLEEETVPAETAAPQQVLACTLEQIQAHTHSDSCYTDGVLTCGLLQVEAHVHTEACLQTAEAEPTLTCAQTEHTHALACYSNPYADLETAEDWERAINNAELDGTTAENLLTIAKTQLGYKESENNYIVLADGFTTNGYTRYGVWAGDAYAAWNETFVEFCLHYAEIEEKDFPRNASGTTWPQVLSNAGMYASTDYTPVPGDLVFFEEKADTFVGIVSSVSDDGDITAILGDYENKVTSVTLSVEDDQITILGYGILPELEEAEPETTEPETTEPETTEPETTEPETTEPETTEPETTEPETTEPETTEPETTEPETTEPETTEPETTEPETTEPETTEPETTEPETTEPEVKEPLTASLSFELTSVDTEVPTTFAARAAFFSASTYALSTASTEVMALDAGTTRSSTLDMSSMITNVTIMHRANSWDSWKTLTNGENIQSGDLLKFDIEYLVPGGTLSEGNDTIYYQLPVNSIPEEKTGNVYDNSGALVGTYNISTSGLIEITFNEHYVEENASGVTIDGTIGFESSVEALDTDDDGEISLKFSDSQVVELVVEQTIRDDLTVEKTAAEVDETTGIIKYQITVSSISGTNGSVSLTDNLSNIAYYTDDSHSFTVVDQNGNTVEVTKSDTDSSAYTPSNGNRYLSMTLPEMDAGDTYIITYYGKVDSISGDSITASNSATVKSKNDDGHILTDSAYTQTPFTNSMVQKAGNYNGETVEWTITIGGSDTDLSGWTLSDTVNGAALQAPVTITYVENDITVTETHTLPFTFPEGTTGPATATYTTTLDYGIGSSNMSNTATMTPPTHIPAYPSYSDNVQVWDQNNTTTNYPLNKNSTGLTVDGNTATIGWDYTISATNGTIYVTNSTDGWYFDDYLQNDQYFTDEQWSTLVTNITNALTSVYGTLSESNGVLTDATGSTIAKIEAYTSGENKVGFKVTVYKNLEKGNTINFAYSSTGSLGDGASYVHFQNKASINDKTWDSASEDYYPVVTKMDGSNSSASDTEHAQMDLEDGTVTWKIQVVIPAGTETEVVITESLPDLVDLTGLTLQLPNYATVNLSAGSTGRFTYNGTTYSVPVSAVGDTNSFTITIPATMATAFAGEKLIFTVTTKLSDDFTLSEDTNKEGFNYRVLENSVSVSTNGKDIGTDSQKQTITNENTTQQVVKVANKGENNIVTYTVEINPEGADLNPNGNTLTIDDVMTYYSNSEEYWFAANLVQSSVKVYSVTTASDGTQTRTELSSTDFGYTYQQTKSGETGWVQVTNKLEVTVPDQQYLVLEYQYQLLGPSGQGTQFNNVASIREVANYGSSSSNNSFNISSSGATAILNGVYVYKVAEGDYTHTLEGAQYELYKWNGTAWNWDQTISSGGEKGKLEIKNLEVNVAYYLIEINAPSGYVLDETRHYFLMYDSAAVSDEEPVLKPDNFPASSYVAKGGNVYITNSPLGTTSAVAKKVWLDADGNETTAPDGSSVEIKLRKIWNAPVTNTVGTDATVNISFGQTSYGTPTHTQTINAKVGDQITITLTTSGTSAKGDAGLMQVTSTQNYHIPYKQVDNTYTFTYLVNGDADLIGWYYDDVQVSSITYQTSAAELTKDMGYVNTITLSAENGWTHTFTGLDLYDLYTADEQTADGTSTGEGQIRGYYTYEVVETGITGGYENNLVSYSEGTDGSLVVTNKPAPTTKVSAEKVWKDTNGNTITAPSGETVTLQLYRKISVTPPTSEDASVSKLSYAITSYGSNYETGTYTYAEGTTITLTIDYAWGGDFYAPVTLNGKELTPTVSTYDYQPVADNPYWLVTGKTLTYTFDLAAGDNSLVIPFYLRSENIESEQFSLTFSSEEPDIKPSGGTAYGSTVTLDGTVDSNGEIVAWNATWTDLPLYETDSVGNITGYYSYYVQEDPVPSGYTVSYSTYDGTVTSGTITVTNTASEEEEEEKTTDISVTKVWKNADGTDGSAPEDFTYINFYLYQDGVLYKNTTGGTDFFTITAEGGWTWSMKDLPAGHTYTVVEDSSGLPAYVSTVTSSENETSIAFTITNQHIPDEVTEETSLTVEKKWLSGTTAKEVQVQLYQKASNSTADGTYGSPVPLNSDNNYTYTWANLPKKATISGVEVTYTYYVRELDSSDYNVIYSTTDAVSSGTITITNAPLKVAIEVSKLWVDSDGKAVDAPMDSIEFQLYYVSGEGDSATDILYGTYTVTAAGVDKDSSTTNDNWKYTVTDLPPGTYKIVETTTDEPIVKTVYFANSIEGDQSASFIVNGTFTIQNTVKTTSVTVKKVWSDSDTKESHDQITFKLYRSVAGETAKTQYGEESYTLSSDNEWSMTIEDLPAQNAEGKAYTYTVEEDPVTGYTASVTTAEDGTITITNTPETVSLTVNKVWRDTKTSHDEISFILYQSVDGQTTPTKYGEYSLPYENSWTRTIEGLPKYDESGNKYTYTVEENSVPGYSSSITTAEDGTITITNTPTTQIGVCKEWIGVTDTSTLSSVTVRLYYVLNSVDSASSIPSSYDLVKTGIPDSYYRFRSDTISGGGWHKTFKNLALYEYDSDGNITGYYTYYVYEEPVAGYTTEYSIETDTDGTPEITVTNTLETVNIPVTKLWDDNDNAGETRPKSITVKLWADGTEVETVNITDSGNWSHTFQDLPKYSFSTDADGKITATLIDYTVTEDSLTNYVTQITENEDGSFTVTNTLNSTELTVNKQWFDASGTEMTADEISAESIQFYLYQNSKLYDPTPENTEDDPVYTITSTGTDSTSTADDWTLTISNLPRFDENGEEYSYTVVELPVDGFRAEYATEGDTRTIKNIEDTAQITVNKTWLNIAEDDQKPVTVQLYQVAGEASVSYATFLGFADEDWYPEIGAATATTVYTNVTGPGSYQLYWDLEATGFDPASGLQVFYVDIYDPDHLLIENGYTVDNLQVLADGVEIECTGTPIIWSQDEYSRFMLYSSLDSHNNLADLINPADIEFAKTLVVNFTLAATNTEELPPFDHSTVVPLYGGTAYGAPVVLSKDNWSFTWTDLPLTDPDDPSIEYTYYVIEQTTGYITTYSNSVSKTGGEITIQNEPTYSEDTPYSVSLGVNKKWTGVDTAPLDSVQFNLYRWENKQAHTVSLNYGEWGWDRVTNITLNNDGATITLKFVGGDSWDWTNNQDQLEVGCNWSDTNTNVDIEMVSKQEVGYSYFNGYNDKDQYYEGFDKVYLYEYKITVKGGSASLYTVFNKKIGTVVYLNNSPDQKVGDDELASNTPTDYTYGIVSIEVADLSSDSSTESQMDWVYKGTYTLTAVDNWETTISPLEPGTYKVEEITQGGYTTTYSYVAIGTDGTVTTTDKIDLTADGTSGTATITNTVELTSLTIDKVWKNASGETFVPTDIESIQFYLYRNGTPYDADTTDLIVHTPYTLKPTDGNWTMTITDLPVVRDSDGKCDYTVEEIAIDGYFATYNYTTTTADGKTTTTAATITNTYDLTDITVSKVWLGVESGTAPVDSITFYLYQNGEPYDADTTDLVAHTPYTLAPSADGNWTMTITGLPKTAPDGTAYVYTANEVKLDGYATSYTTGDGSITIINEPETQIVVEKKWASGVAAEDIAVQLYQVLIQNDAAVDSKAFGEPISITAADSWTKTIQDLPLYAYDSNGAVIGTYAYYVVETGGNYVVTYSAVNGEGTAVTTTYAEDASPAVSNGTITVTNVESLLVSVAVEKQWKGLANETLAAPGAESVTVWLLRDGEKYDVNGDGAVTDADAIILSDDNDWEAVIDGLPKYSDAENSVPYTYSFEETDVPDGFNVSYSTASDGTYLVTNKLSNETSISVEKAWLDSDGTPLDNLSSIQEIYYDVYQVFTPVGSTAVATVSEETTTETVNVTINVGWWSGSDIINRTESVAVGSTLVIDYWTTSQYCGLNNYQNITIAKEVISEEKVDDYTTKYHIQFTCVLDGSVADPTFYGHLNMAETDGYTATAKITPPTSTGGSTSSVTVPTGGDLYTSGTISYGEGWKDTITGLPLYEYDLVTGDIVGYYTYYIIERDSATGNYTLVSYSENNTSAGINQGTITVTNQVVEIPGYELPSTGGTGTAPTTLGGLAMILGAAYLLLMQHKRRKRTA